MSKINFIIWNNDDGQIGVEKTNSSYQKPIPIDASDSEAISKEIASPPKAGSQ
jgi:hypothetical protein